MISIIITSFKELKTIGRCIDSIISQNISKDYEVVVSAPDKETLDIAEEYSKKNKRIRIFKDPGKGKSKAINLLLPSLKGDVLIFTDGDVFLSENSINPIVALFKDEKVGCVSGHPVSLEDRKKLLGYWSHMLCNSAHLLRLKRDANNNYLECSGYLWAFRNRVITRFPLDVAEDSVIPGFFWKKGFKIKYSPESKVFVKYPTTLKDYLEQKKRTIKAHEKLNKYLTNIPKMKTFFEEFLGMFSVLRYASNLQELFYSLLAIPFRGYLWFIAYKEYLSKREYQDAWKRIESTK